MPIEIRSSHSVYPVYIDEEGSREGLLKGEKSVFLVDRKLWSLYGQTELRAIDPRRLILLEASERRKEFESLAPVYRKTLAMGVRKTATIVAIGGGIIQDIAGFVASTLFRGLPWAFLPTTLLAQADSCIGAKTSINLGPMKNQIGTFYPPNAVCISTAFLTTLSPAEIDSGLGEIAKFSIIDGLGRWSEFEDDLPSILARDTSTLRKWIHISLTIKKRFIEEDEFDKGVRNHLNFGHCFGHAIESATKNRVPHGQAVSLGIVLADLVARNRGLASSGRFEAHRATLGRIVGYSFRRLALDEKAMVEAMRRDKKRTGEGFAVVVSRDDDTMARLDDVGIDEIRFALEEARGL